MRSIQRLVVGPNRRRKSRRRLAAWRGELPKRVEDWDPGLQEKLRVYVATQMKRPPISRESAEAVAEHQVRADVLLGRAVWPVILDLRGQGVS